MKDRFLQLVSEIERIEGCFHFSGSSRGTAKLEVIYDVPEFQYWLQDITLVVQDIVDRTGDNYAIETLNGLDPRSDDYNDKRRFNIIKGRLLAMAKNIDKYYPNVVASPSMKRPKIFISHASKDAMYVEAIVDLLSRIGLKNCDILCTSLAGYGIPIRENFLNYLREQFELFDLNVIIVHSPNYYKSAISMNEMGAAWVRRTDCTSLLLPGFNYNEMAGAVNNSNIAIKLDGNELELKDKLNQLMEILVHKFGVARVPSIVWEQWRDSFIKRVHEIASKAPPAEKTDAEKIDELKKELIKSEKETEYYKRLFVKAYTGKNDEEVEEEYASILMAYSMRSEVDD